MGESMKLRLTVWALVAIIFISGFLIVIKTL